MRVERRALADTGLVASRLGLADSYGLDAAGVERAFHEYGVNYVFVSSRSRQCLEGVRRLVRAGHRDQLVIASGAGMPTGGGVERAWAAEARALGVEVIDVFHLFWVQAHWYVAGKTWPAMRRLKEQGKVRALALSCHDRSLARELARELDLDVLMIRYNAAHRGAEHDIFEPLGPGRPAVVAYTATRWGRLLKPAAGLGPMTGGECYRFALSHPRVDVVLSAPASEAELRENVAAVAQGPLEPPRLDEVRRFGDAVRSSAVGRFGFAGA
ncbi:MAG TPA: aldo/keto reductase [Polyangiaceae bacterium]|nr:aldo/keto reductase [Polyangiaceae bacterium]